VIEVGFAVKSEVVQETVFEQELAPDAIVQLDAVRAPVGVGALLTTTKAESVASDEPAFEHVISNK
jgi:hypothetical protein